MIASIMGLLQDPTAIYAALESTGVTVDGAVALTSPFLSYFGPFMLLAIGLVLVGRLFGVGKRAAR